MLTTIKNNALSLAIFACITTGLVAITNYLTHDKIARQQQQQLQSLLSQVITTDLHDNKLTDACILINDPLLGSTSPMKAYIATLNGEPSAIAMEAITSGYNGTIKLIVGMRLDGTITATRVLSHTETPGLGDKIDLRVSSWITSFKDKKVSDSNAKLWQVRKDGGQFDQFTGATITPRAVVKAVYNAALYLQKNQHHLLNQPYQCGNQHGRS